MKVLWVSVVLLFPLLLLAQSKKKTTAFTPHRAYLDSIEEDQLITVFSEPGKNWKNCTKVLEESTQRMICQEAVGWPGRDANITVIGPSVKRTVIDPYSEEQKEIVETYVEVEFEYSRQGASGTVYHQKGKGYIEEYQLSRSRRNSFFGAQDKEKAKEDCPPVLDQKDPNSVLKELAKDLTVLEKSIHSADVVATAKVLNNVVGFCPLKPPSQYPHYLTEDKQNPYDRLVLQQLKKVPVPDVLKEDNSKMTRDDLINIDAIARTLYGEMGICFRYGLHYPMAVAKVIMNRAEVENEKYRRIFIQPPHEEGVPVVTKVATTLSQFSMWQKQAHVVNKKTGKTEKGPNGPLHQGLCPPRVAGQPFYRKDAPASQFENDVWTNALRIATEAVLNPEKFAKRTSNVSYFYYTSNLARLRNTDKLPRGARFINKMEQVFPEVEGRKINKNECLEMWYDKETF